MAGRFFISYSRQDAEAAQAIASDLRDLGKDIWLDRELTGGQQWWDAILQRIRTCDVFVLVLSETSLRSKACRSELDYAHALQRTVLPIAPGPVIDSLLPPHLANIQRIPAGDVKQLARALLELGDNPPLPDPLPASPPVPISYLDKLADVLEQPSVPLTEQRNLLGALRHQLQVGEEREAALQLLHRLRQHRDVNAWVAAEIDTELRQHQAAPSTAGPVHSPPLGSPSPPPGGQMHSPPSGGRVTSPPQAGAGYAASQSPPGYQAGMPHSPGAYGRPGPAPAQYGPRPNAPNVTTALVLGILGIFFCGVILGPIALIMGNNALKEIQRSGGAYGGEGQARAAQVLGVIAIIAWVLWIVIYLSLPTESEGF